MDFYWKLGRDIEAKQYTNTYGSEFYKNLSLDLKHEMLGVKGELTNNLALYEPVLQFVRKTWENNWGRDALLNWLDTDLYERDGKAVTNFQSTLPAVQSDLAQQMTKDPYQFDFLTFSV